MRELSVPAALDGARLDAALHELAPELSRRTARALAASGAVRVGGVRAAAADRVRAGAVIAYEPAVVETSVALGLGVVHADADVLVLHKPPGLAVHGGPLVKDSVALRLAKAFPGAGLAHRLDRGASGLLLVGRNADSLRALAAAMETGAIERRYLALVVGAFEGDRAIDVKLRVTDEPRGDRPKVVPDPIGGQPARTLVRARERLRDATLVEAVLETGRTHQVRAHLASIGHPILGDPRYGDPAANAAARATHGVARPLLHASFLWMVHPRTGARLELASALEPDFARVLGAGGRSRSGG